MIPYVLDDLREEIRDAFLTEIGMTGFRWDNERVFVFVGSNGAGKSLLRRVFQQFLKKNKIEVIHLSQQGRTTGGFARAFIYGDEDNEATGVISCRTIRSGISTSNKRENDHVLLYDEPEIGMAEETQFGVARYLRESLEANWPDKLRALIILTHSRYFARELCAMDGSKFAWLHHPGATLDDWLHREIVPIDPEVAMKDGLERFRRIAKIMEE